MKTIAKADVPGLTKVQSPIHNRLDCRFDHYCVDSLHGSVVAGAWKPVSFCHCRWGDHRLLPLADGLARITSGEN